MTGKPRPPSNSGSGDDGTPPGRPGKGDGAGRSGGPGNVAEAQDDVAGSASRGRASPDVTPGRTAPDFADVAIDPNKISGYAMKPDHPVGGNKYRVIHSATGLDTTDAPLIEQQIRDGVRNGTPILGKVDEYGRRWAVDVPLTGPTGSILVRTAWILDAGSAVPRLVTISFP
ncbi:DUF6883 domain-containing protein [Actinoplanes sp. CA-054009]